MTEFADLHFRSAFLERHALPDIGYPVPLARFLDLIGSSDALDLAELLYWLQQQSSEAARDFRQYEPAMARLAQLLAPEDDQSDTASVQGDDWWLELGPVDLDAEIVTIQRDDELVAAIAPREDGRLRVAVFRPLDASSATSLINLSTTPTRTARSTCATTTGSTRRTLPAAWARCTAAEAGSSFCRTGNTASVSCTTAPRAPCSTRSARSPRADPPKSPPNSASTTSSRSRRTIDPRAIPPP